MTWIIKQSDSSVVKKCRVPPPGGSVVDLLTSQQRCYVLPHQKNWFDPLMCCKTLSWVSVSRIGLQVEWLPSVAVPCVIQRVTMSSSSYVFFNQICGLTTITRSVGVPTASQTKISTPYIMNEWMVVALVSNVGVSRGVQRSDRGLKVAKNLNSSLACSEWVLLLTHGGLYLQWLKTI